MSSFKKQTESKKNYQTLLFDLDGTLTDSQEGITKSVQYALKKHGIEVSDLESLKVFIGPPLIDSFRTFYGFDDDEARAAVADYREYFSVKGIFENRLYEGIPELLGQLKNAGKNLLVATSKPEEFTLRILEHFHIREYFSFVAGATMDERRSKKSDVIAYALEQLGEESLAETVMIGDRHHDIDGAKENGIDSIGVLYGFGDEAELRAAGAAYIVPSVAGLGTFFLRAR